MSTLACCEVYAGYETVPVLNGVSFSVESSEILVVLGRNGVGKTTLMRVLIGLIPPWGGTIEFNGINICGMRAHQVARLGIGYVPQGRRIIGRLTVHENLVAGTRARGSAADKVPEYVLEYFPILKERFSQKGGTLSGGEQQMLTIARALAGEPKLLLLDEPSEGVQPTIVQQIGDLIDRIVRERSVSVVLVEQNLELALKIGHRCIVMDKGRIVYEGDAQTMQDPSLQQRYLAI